MKKAKQNMPKHQTSQPLRREFLVGAERVQKYVGKRKVSFYYQYPDKTSETLASAPVGDRKAIADAEATARRRALDIQRGQIIAGSVAELIDRFRVEEDPRHYLDQSKDGKNVRKGIYANLTKCFGKMAPQSLKMLHGYQYLDARARSGAPAKANKEMALMSTMCNYWVRWGVIEANPFRGLIQNKTDKDVRVVERSQILRFYLWSRRQDNKQFQMMGCAALFTYLTGFRAAEVRPFHASGLTPEGVKVVGAKRKKGEAIVVKLREWSPRLRMVVKRTQQIYSHNRLYLFANRHGKAYTRSGWGSVWQDACWEWLASFDKEAAAALAAKKEWETRRRKDKKLPVFEPEFQLVEHPDYFSLLDVRPAAITTKIEKRKEDAYDFAAHANPATTHRHYDRRRIKKAGATE